jgi:hypothetical protein
MSRAMGPSSLRADVDQAADRINTLDSPVRDKEFDAHYNGRAQQAADNITTEGELERLAAGGTTKGTSLEKAKDRFEKQAVPMLTQGESRGAAAMAGVLGDIQLKSPKAPPPASKIDLPLPARTEKYTLAEARKVVAEKLPGMLEVSTSMRVTGLDHGILYGHYSDKVNVAALMDRLFKNDPNTVLTPKSLRFEHLEGDPYTDAKAPVTPGKQMLSAGELAATKAIYAALFVPKRSVDLKSPEPVMTPVEKFKGGVEVAMKTDYALSPSSDSVIATSRHSVVVNAPPGAIVLYGQGHQATLNKTAEVPQDGRLVLSYLGSEPVAGRVLVNKDPSGLLSPQLMGSFAIQLPDDDRHVIGLR